MSSIEIVSASPSELRHALRLSLIGRGRTGSEVERNVTAFLEYARAMSLDAGPQWFCRADGRAISACTAVESSGRSAILLLGVPDDRPGFLDGQVQLIERAAACLAERGNRLIQALIEVDDGFNRRALERAGFLDIAVLEYLELKMISAPLRAAALPPPEYRQASLTWLDYGEKTHTRFADLIRATYEDSRDCPGLSDLREIEDVIAGHKATGRFSPHRWHLLLIEDVPAACILLSENPLRPVLELVYMGVHPRFRGRGLGRYILDKGLEWASAERFHTVTLAVDARNAPARDLYRLAGFVRATSRRALVRPVVLTSIEP